MRPCRILGQICDNGLLISRKIQFYASIQPELRQRIEKAINEHTVVSQSHMTPELKLHLLTSDCALYHRKYEELTDNQPEFFEEPWWAIYWPGGQALARFILDNGAEIFRQIRALKKERAESEVIRVLDIGCGCGAAAIAAKMAGADDVLANDIDMGSWKTFVENFKIFCKKIFYLKI